MERRTIRNAVDVLFFVCMFVLLQLMTSLIGLVSGNNACAVAVADILIIAVFLLFRWSTVSLVRVKSHTIGSILWTILLGLALVIPSAWSSEVIGIEMPEEQAQLMLSVISTPIGAVSVVLLAPLAEEIVFRGAILKTLLTTLPISKNRYWISITLSALLFAFVHFNLAQGIHAFIIGMLMGWLYFNTGSVLLCMVIHFVNNSAAYLAFAFSGNPEMTLDEMFGGNATLMYASLVASAIVAVGCIYKLATTKLIK